MKIGVTHQAVLPELGAPEPARFVGTRYDDQCGMDPDIPEKLFPGEPVNVLGRGWGVLVKEGENGWWVEFQDDSLEYYKNSIDGLRPSQFHDFRRMTSPQKLTYFDDSMHMTCIEYVNGHKFHGEVRYYDDGMLLSRKEYKEGHVNHGKIMYYKNGKLIRVKYKEGHEYHGQIRHVNDGKVIRCEYEEGHKFHGEIRHVKDGEPIRFEFSEGHERHGEIWQKDIEKNQSRLEFSQGHKFHGEIRYYEGVRAGESKLTRIEFSEGHLLHGEVRHYVDCKLIKIDFPDGRSFVPEEKKRKVEVVVVE